MKKYLSVPHYIIEYNDKYLLQFYVAIQYVAKKLGGRNCVICPDTFKYTFGFPERRIKEQYKRLDEELSFLEKLKDGNIVVYNNGFNVKWEDRFEMLNDKEFDLLIEDAALLQHYLTLLKVANGMKTPWSGLDKLASLEGVSPRTVSELNKKLVNLGLVEIKHRMDKCNEYIMKYNEDKSELFG